MGFSFFQIYLLVRREQKTQKHLPKSGRCWLGYANFTLLRLCANADMDRCIFSTVVRDGVR